MKHIRILLILALALMTGALTVNAQEDDDPFGDPLEADVAVTIYNEGTALIRDRRDFELTEGVNTIDFTDVASSIDATSVSFVSLTDPAGTTVLEQNYVYDLVGTGALLARYIDQTITVTASDGTVYTGTLLSGAGSDIILSDDDGQVIVISKATARDIQFPALPDGLITRPTLRWLVLSALSGVQQVELTYLARGISWTADYNVLLGTDNTSLDLNGWVTLSNSSGTAYRDAQVKLVAGDINREVVEEMFMRETEMAMDMAVPAAPGVEQREFFEYQLYEIGRTVTVGNNETKQVEFVTGADVPANTYFVYDASLPNFGYFGPVTDQAYTMTGITDVQSWLSFSTDDETGLGADLPAGRIRVYQEDVDGAALLIGENRIDHTPQGEEIDIMLGNAFDLVGERIQTDFEIISRTVLRESFEIRLRNRKDSDTVQIRVPERLMRWSNWEIVESSHEFEQRDAATIEFRVDVPPGEETIITYTVMYSFPS